MGIHDLSTIYMCRDEYTEMPEKMRLFYESLRRPNQKTSGASSTHSSQPSFNNFRKIADGMSYSKQIKQKKEISVEDQIKYDLTDFTNKLNDSNYDKLFDQYVTQKYTTTNDEDTTKMLFVNMMIEVLISKVKVDSKFVKLYARLSNDLCKFLTSINFKTKLLKVCNETFMAYVTNSNNKKMEMNSFVAFLSELFMIDVLTEKTMSQCYKNLIQNRTPTNTEMMIKMLQIIYHKLSATAQTSIQNQFEQGVKEGRYSFREQTLLQELMSCDSAK